MGRDGGIALCDRRRGREGIVQYMPRFDYKYHNIGHIGCYIIIANTIHVAIVT